MFSASLPSTEDRRSALSLTLSATNSCEGQHISRWRRWHCRLGNREHNLGRLNRRHCCAPPYQVQVDCQELCKNFNLYSLPKKCLRISIHSLTRKALNCFFLQFLKQKAERGKWSFLLTLNGALAGMVSFLLILIGSFLSFYQIHVSSLHGVCRIVPKTLNPWANCTFGNPIIFFLIFLALFEFVERN